MGTPLASDLLNVVCSYPGCDEPAYCRARVKIDRRSKWTDPRDLCWLHMEHLARYSYATQIN